MSAFVTVRVALFLLANSMQPVGADIISDITVSETDEFSALQIKAEVFWKPILNAAEDVKMEKHLELYADVEAAINELPAENTYVRQTLREALDHLKRADDASFKQALASSSIATEKLNAPYGQTGDSFSFLHGGQNFLKAALKRFIGGGRYPEKLVDHVEQRQADILPVLRGAASITGNILTDCRLASKKGFDVRKYDIYNKGVPKTPKRASELADKIIDAAGETRHRFTSSITDLVKGITRDFEGKQEDASVTVTKASLQGLHESIAKAEATMSTKQPLIRSEEQLIGV
jgi:cell division septum initiation protein DivIVA